MDIGEYIDGIILALVTKTINHVASIADIRSDIGRLKDMTDGFGAMIERAAPLSGEADEITAAVNELARGVRSISDQAQNLEDEIDGISIDINEAMGSAEDMNEARLKSDAENKSKTLFLARMSHEIRTPMNAIIGMSELAEREYGKPGGLEYINDIKQAGANLLSIINEILDFSKIESGRLEITNARYEMASLLNDVRAIIKVRIGEKPIQFDADADESIPACMIGDEARIRQVLLNILSNAVKYTESGFIKLTVRHLLSGDEARIEFEVADSGTGIKEEDMPRLFADFSRVDASHTKYIEGIGLGLSIARTICRAMGGDITVSSEYGVGATFTATIRQVIADGRPMGPSRNKIAIRAGASRVRFSAPDFRLLIVDDNATNLKVAEGLLAPYMMRIDTRDSGQGAIKLLGEKNYDLVFMDHMMPGMDGVEATRAIRAIGGRCAKLPVVALTANAVSGMREMFLENGFDDFLSKPIEILKLNELIERWVPPARRKKAITAEENKTSAFIEIDGLDTARGVEMTGGTAANYMSVLELYCKDSASRIGNLYLSWAQSDPQSFATHVHALKSASSSIGATDLSKKAAFLEDATRRGDISIIRERISDFRENLASMVQRIQAALDAFKKSPGDGKGGIYSSSDEILPRLRLLKEVLAAEDVGAADKILAELDALRLDKETGAAISDITALVLISEFREAEKILSGRISLGSAD
ncbi:MAG: response regulator [Synergistaceae bacterium]|jgi:signal transduction histidine kinase/FixJ family two-component response regulator/HPt (histidine-containing phosphotransfer) domain-containing protein|nr:response regulator [Synergistaceae bacterium]